MLTSKTVEYFDCREASKEIGVNWDECYFTEGVPYNQFATLYLDDESIDGMEHDAKYDTTTANELKWIKYFHSLGYHDRVYIMIKE